MFIKYIENFSLHQNQPSLFPGEEISATLVEHVQIGSQRIARYINEFWTAKQRQANAIHEVSYRACFKPQLPHFFISRLTEENDTVYDPFSGRGTTVIEAALMNRRIIGNDINPLSKILSEPRLLIPDGNALENYLKNIPFYKGLKAGMDLSMFYHPDTESEIVSLRNYLLEKEKNNELNDLDKWIRMVATNRLTGHSKGFFSVYTLPPNQAVSPERQIKINRQRDQQPDYRDVKALILKKTKSLIKHISRQEKLRLKEIHKTALFLTEDARRTPQIPDNSVQLTVTSPPFLDVVQYAKDNWLRAWFNGIDTGRVEKKITVTRSLNEWTKVMQDVFHELYRITKKGGYVAFEVGEVRNGKIKLDEYVVPLALKAGFKMEGILINKQQFTKTANIWKVKNNQKGTNTNRIVLIRK